MHFLTKNQVNWLFIFLASICFLVIVFTVFIQSSSDRLSCTRSWTESLSSTANASPPLPEGFLKSALCFSRAPRLGESAVLTYRFHPVFLKSDAMEGVVRFTIPESFVIEKGSLVQTVMIDYTSTDIQEVSITIRPTKVGFYLVSAEAVPTTLQSGGGHDEVRLEVDVDKGQVGSSPVNNWYKGGAAGSSPGSYWYWSSLTEGHKNSLSDTDNQLESSLGTSPTIKLGEEFDVKYTVHPSQDSLNAEFLTLRMLFPAEGFDVVRYTAPLIGSAEVSYGEIRWTIGKSEMTPAVEGPLTLNATLRAKNIGFGEIKARYQEQVVLDEGHTRTGSISVFDEKTVYLYLDKFGTSWVKYKEG